MISFICACEKKKELGVDSMREESWVGEMGEGSQGLQIFRHMVHKFWGCNILHGD